MTDLDLAAVRQRCRAASPGSWAVGENIHTGEMCHHWTIHSPADEYPIAATTWLLDRLSREQHLATAEFIAHARQDLPRLVAALEAAQAELAQLSGSPPGAGGQPGAALRTAIS